jgi:DHA2 family methylenomycin A resistance protein-like MFS transporter
MSTVAQSTPPAPSGITRPGPHSNAANVVLLAALLGFFVTALDALVVNVALPVIGRDLGGGMTGLQWVVDGYTLMFAAFMLSTGALSDRIGASRAFAGGLAVFTLASLVCGLAPHIGVLVAARMVQGIAAAVLMPASLALVRQAFPDPARRVRAIAIWTAGGAIAAAAGPAAGGLLTAAWNWRAIFFINLPVGVVGLVLLRRTVPSRQRPAPLDLGGQVTAIIGLGALTIAVIEGGARGYGAPEVVAAFAVAAIALAIFLVVESRHRHPVMPLGLFRLRPASVSVAAGFTINVAFYGTIFVLGLFFQRVLHQSPATAGLMFVPMTSVVAVSNLFVAARVISRYGARLPIALGQAGTAGGLLLLLTVTSHTAPVVVALLTIPVGLAGALAVPALTTMLIGTVAADRAGTAAGVLNAVRQVGAALAVAVFGALVADQGAFSIGMRICLVIAAAALAATTVAALVLLPRHRTPTAGAGAGARTAS